MISFPCDKCGCCCAVMNCPMFDTKTRLCTCYENRPLICRIDEAAKLLHAYIDPEVWRKTNRDECFKLQKDTNGK